MEWREKATQALAVSYMQLLALEHRHTHESTEMSHRTESPAVAHQHSVFRDPSSPCSKAGTFLFVAPKSKGIFLSLYVFKQSSNFWNSKYINIILSKFISIFKYLVHILGN